MFSPMVQMFIFEEGEEERGGGGKAEEPPLLPHHGVLHDDVHLTPYKPVIMMLFALA